MLISITITLTSFCMIIEAIYGVTPEDEGLQRLFRQRSVSDWRNVWHAEAYSRCRKRLEEHMDLVCEKDPYRKVSRRSGGDRNSNSVRFDFNTKSKFSLYWIKNHLAHTMLRSRRDERRIVSGKSITAQCCSQTGCTWEEYAEYCPHNRYTLRERFKKLKR